MKLMRMCGAFLICWNTLAILVVLLRYKRSTTVTAVFRPLKAEVESLPRLKIRIPRNVDVARFRDENLNVPSVYFNASFDRRMSVLGKRPLAFPRLQDIQFNNVYWQTFETNGATYFLYNAYYDDRESTLDRSSGKSGRRRAWVRIVSMVDVAPPPLPIRCALWFQSGQRMAWATSVTVEHLWRTDWGVVRNGTLQPCLVSCLVPTFRRSNKASAAAIPDMVSLMNDTQYRPTTNLRIRLDDRRSGSHHVPKKDFVVCVKGLEFPTREDVAIRLLEWIHLVRLLGADRVFVYELDVHPTIARLLDFLEAEDMVKVVPLSLPGNQPNLPKLRNLFLSKLIGNKRLNEIIPYNDCLYRNIHTYRYVILLDIDEVIMPLSVDSWSALALQFQSAVSNSSNGRKDYFGRPASYNVRNVYFFDDLEYDGVEMSDIPEYLHMSRHVVRASKFSERGRYVKCFHDTDCVRSVHNHFPFSCLRRCGPMCASYDVAPELAELQHYRADCHDMDVADCRRLFKNDTLLDFSIWRFKDELTLRVSRDMELLQLKGPTRTTTAMSADLDQL